MSFGYGFRVAWKRTLSIRKYGSMNMISGLIFRWENKLFEFIRIKMRKIRSMCLVKSERTHLISNHGENWKQRERLICLRMPKYISMNVSAMCPEGKTTLRASRDQNENSDETKHFKISKSSLS